MDDRSLGEIEPQASSLQAILLELQSTKRQAEVTPANFPATLSFDGPALSDGQALALESAQIFEATGQSCESVFLIGINPVSLEFEFAAEPSPFNESITKESGSTIILHPGKITQDARVMLWLRRAEQGMQLGDQYNPAYTNAITAHSHPPVQRSNEDPRLAVEPGWNIALNAGPPSLTDALAVAVRPKTPVQVFGQGITFLMIPTAATTFELRGFGTLQRVGSVENERAGHKICYKLTTPDGKHMAVLIGGYQGSLGMQIPQDRFITLLSAQPTRQQIEYAELKTYFIAPISDTQAVFLQEWGGEPLDATRNPLLFFWAQLSKMRARRRIDAIPDTHPELISRAYQELDHPRNLLHKPGYWPAVVDVQIEQYVGSY